MDKQYYFCFNDFTEARVSPSNSVFVLPSSVPRQKLFTFCLNSLNTILEDFRLLLNIFECIFSHHWA